MTSSRAGPKGPGRESEEAFPCIIVVSGGDRIKYGCQPVCSEVSRGTGYPLRDLSGWTVLSAIASDVTLKGVGMEGEQGGKEM